MEDDNVSAATWTMHHAMNDILEHFPYSAAFVQNKAAEKTVDTYLQTMRVKDMVKEEFPSN